MFEIATDLYREHKDICCPARIVLISEQVRTCLCIYAQDVDAILRGPVATG